MLKLKIIYTIGIFCLSLTLFGQNMWVVNDDPQRAPEHFATFQEAYDAASSGDIIYVLGNQQSNSTYGTVTIAKPLTIIGTGIRLNNAADSLTINDKISRFQSVFIDSTADGTSLYGLHINSQLYIGADDVVINSCNTTINHRKSWDGNGPAELNNITVERCWIRSVNLSSFAEHVSNLLFRNNIVAGPFNGDSDQLPWVIDHNTFLNGSFAIANSVVGSNIFGMAIVNDYSIQLQGNSFNNNIAIDGHIPSGAGNQPLVECDSIFQLTGFTGFSACHPNSLSDDKGIVLSSNSPALGAGENGTDVGCTDGSNPYVLGGFPPFPIVNKFNVQGISSTNNLNVEIKVSSQN